MKNTTEIKNAVLKNIRLNSTHYFVMKIPNKWELKQIVFNHSLDIEFQVFVIIYKKFTAKVHFFLVIDVTLAANNPLHFAKDFLERI